MSAPLLAGAFSVVWEWENSELISELIEYHSARGTFSAETAIRAEVIEWSRVATARRPDQRSSTNSLRSPPARRCAAGRSLTRLGPLPPLRMDPTGGPVLARYRELALERYGQHVTADEAAWSTWP